MGRESVLLSMPSVAKEEAPFGCPDMNPKPSIDTGHTLQQVLIKYLLCAGHLHTCTPSSFLSHLLFPFIHTIILTSTIRSLEPREATEQSQARTSLLPPIRASLPVPATEYPSLSRQVQQLSKPAQPARLCHSEQRHCPSRNLKDSDFLLSRGRAGD